MGTQSPETCRERNKHTKRNCAPSWLCLQDCRVYFQPSFSQGNPAWNSCICSYILLSLCQLFVLACIPLVSFHPSIRCRRGSRLQNRTISNLHCEICRWPCATGWWRNCATAQVDGLFNVASAVQWKWMWENVSWWESQGSPSAIQNVMDQKQLEILEYFSYLGSRINEWRKMYTGH